MKVTLRKFLEITGEDIIQTWLANLYVDEYDELFEEWTPKIKIQYIKNVRELDPYMDYEIYNFEQSVCYEIESQDIYVRKIM